MQRVIRFQQYNNIMTWLHHEWYSCCNLYGSVLTWYVRHWVSNSARNSYIKRPVGIAAKLLRNADTQVPASRGIIQTAEVHNIINIIFPGLMVYVPLLHAWSITHAELHNKHPRPRVVTPYLPWSTKVPWCAPVARVIESLIASANAYFASSWTLVPITWHF